MFGVDGICLIQFCFVVDSLDNDCHPTSGMKLATCPWRVQYYIEVFVSVAQCVFHMILFAAETWNVGKREMEFLKYEHSDSSDWNYVFMRHALVIFDMVR